MIYHFFRDHLSLRHLSGTSCRLAIAQLRLTYALPTVLWFSGVRTWKRQACGENNQTSYIGTVEDTVLYPVKCSPSSRPVSPQSLDAPEADSGRDRGASRESSGDGLRRSSTSACNERLGGLRVRWADGLQKPLVPGRRGQIQRAGSMEPARRPDILPVRNRDTTPESRSVRVKSEHHGHQPTMGVSG